MVLEWFAILPWWGWVLVAGGALVALWLTMAFSSARSTLDGMDRVLGPKGHHDGPSPVESSPIEYFDEDRGRRGA